MGGSDTLTVPAKHALRLNSWGLYFPALSQSVDRGGFALLPPEVFLWHQAAYPYVRAVSHLESFDASVMNEFRRWACKLGHSLEPRFLPYL